MLNSKGYSIHAERMQRLPTAADPLGWLESLVATLPMAKDKYLDQLATWDLIQVFLPP